MSWINSKRVLYELVEELIKSHKLCIIKKNKVAFEPDDVVVCHYIKGTFKVITVTPYYVVIASVTDKAELHYVGSDFLQKIQIDKKVMKVLFNE